MQVRVRKRTWVVRDVRRASLSSDLLGPEPREPQHLVELASLEEDTLNEEMRVVWEIEPATELLGRSALPDLKGWDNAEDWEAFMLAVRWGAIASADIKALQSPFRSGIQIEDYQLDPVVRSLSMARTNLLIADDVGLGKTIEAGLVVQELMLRNRVRSVLIVCPSSLQLQWQEQMRDKFGLEFRRVDSEILKRLRRQRGLFVNPWTHHPRLITSMDFLKRERPLRLFQEVVPPPGAPAFRRRFDLLIVDEAHNVAPAGTGRYALDSLRTQALREVARNFEHRLFLSATPHNGYSESFSALLELLDDQRFARGVQPEPKQLEKVMVRRLKSELPPDDLGRSRFPVRRLRELEVDYGAPEEELHHGFEEFSRLRRESCSSYAGEFVLKLLKKRLFSSPAAFAYTLERHQDVARKVTPRRDVPDRVLKRRVEGLDEDFLDDDAFQQMETELVEEASRLLPPLSEGERRLAAQLLEQSARLTEKGDAKFRAFLEYLQATVRPGGRWGETRVIVFTEYRDTQKWLHELLAARELATQDRLLTLYGGMDPEDRERIKAAFQAHPSQSKVRILLATDAASEGIDLQNHCSRLLHYEIPWNPNRLEQRNGRVDRHGQRQSEVLIHHFVGRGYQDRMRGQTEMAPGSLHGDLEFLARVAHKVETIRTDLGKVGPVLAEQVEAAMLGKRRTLDTARAEEAALKARKVLKFELDVREQCRRLKTQLDESRRELSLSGSNLLSVVQVGLRIARQPPLTPVTVRRAAGELTESAITAWRLPPLKGSWTQAAQGLEHPHTQEIRPVVFDENLVRGHDDVVLMHLNHRLVQMCLRILRAEVWGGEKLHRHALFSVPRPLVAHPGVVAWGRLVVVGPLGHCLHEEIITAAGELQQGKLVPLNQTNTARLLDAVKTSGTVGEANVRERLSELWPELRSPLLRALEARSRERGKSLQGLLEKRKTQEIEDLTTVLQQLRDLIAKQLADPESDQLLFDFEEFNTPEKQQFERNKDALRARVEEIPGELERERRRIEDRYRDPEPRLFPLAVSWIVPEGS